MSEPHSLYVRATVTPQRYEQMMSSQVPVGGAFNDWQGWIDGQLGQSVAVPERFLQAFADISLQQFVSGVCEAPHCMAHTHYDRNRGIWQLGILQLTENYAEMIPYLAAVRGCAAFNQPQADDFAAIYPFVWGDTGYAACISLHNGQSTLIDELTAEQRQEADSFLGAIMTRAMKGSG